MWIKTPSLFGRKLILPFTSVVPKIFGLAPSCVPKQNPNIHPQTYKLLIVFLVLVLHVKWVFPLNVIHCKVKARCISGTLCVCVCVGVQMCHCHLLAAHVFSHYPPGSFLHQQGIQYHSLWESLIYINNAINIKANDSHSLHLIGGF